MTLTLLLLLATPSPTPAVVPTPHYECRDVARRVSCCERVTWRYRHWISPPTWEAVREPVGCVVVPEVEP